ncbi:MULTISPECIES: hypothetical protein [Moorena]|uniref:Uncharacterized protein n=1 Tax=Moorena producens (strain JHB) TaxID=1454205 RepID=A0A1D9G3C3_MOOP1|nr:MULTISPECIES: hypothetical protein [Moorena]AOY82025.1 hypothetical protein BJP36_21105 [Moorena producens JHB]NEP30213.1 hypothetical protein [Moorena sp. SIO3B2]NEQ08186.1 hypothetical protein [Moorena sp. SIO4E2]NEQ62258.1 hypothetical protein [Moorena sp. SIO4A1]NER87459.1 hypothetical protein [Moorena sp. SIO3A2]
MDAFAPLPPQWTKSATHALEFCCPSCRASVLEAEKVWINRSSPVMGEDHRRKWQEFYQCQCGYVWWAWSSDRPPSELSNRENPPIV